MTIQEKIEFIDEFLAGLEDWMKGQESDSVSKCRTYLNDLKEMEQTLSLDVANEDTIVNIPQKSLGKYCLKKIEDKPIFRDNSKDEQLKEIIKDLLRIYVFDVDENGNALATFSDISKVVEKAINAIEGKIIFRDEKKL
jgi:hypothetical protein